jgi:hypothetical protein
MHRVFCIALAATTLTACMRVGHYKANIANDSYGVTHSCVTRCNALNEGDAAYAACFASCPGAVYTDGACDRDALEFGEVCADHSELRNGATAGLLLGAILAGVLIYEAATFELDFGDGFDGYEHSYDPH